MAKRVSVDKWLFYTIMGLVVCGLLMVFSASTGVSENKYNSPYVLAINQVRQAVLGIIALFILMRVDYRRYNSAKFIYPLMAVTALMLMAVFLWPRMNGAHRWIRFHGSTLQPSEVAKPVIVLFLAWFLQTRIHKINDVRNTLLPALLPPLVYIGLIAMEPDLGTAMVCATVVLLMLFLAGVRIKYILVALAAAVPVMYNQLHVGFRLQRIKVFLNPDLDRKGRGYNSIQSLIAVGSGGLRGRGFMEGVQKLFYLPEPHTDYIFAVICEELGLIGAACVLIAFCVLGYRGLRAAYLSTDPFARFLAFGLTTALLVQAFLNIFVVLAMAPAKGIPLPFISSGGTSIFVTLACMGVLLNITREID